MLLKLNFKKIIIAYSGQDYSIAYTPLLKNPRIQIIEVENIGYDFKKYYTGLLATKNEKYNRIWLINDSFIITNPNIFVGEMWRQILYNDLTGCYYSHEIKEHIQSYFMVLSNKMVEYFVSKLTPYKFTSINSARDKKKLILDLEVNLTNEILNNKNYTCGTLHKTSNTLKGNPILAFGPTDGWIKTNENCAILEKFNLSPIQKFILYITGCTEFIETYEIFYMKKNRNPHIKGIPRDFFKNKWNMLSICRNLIPSYRDKHSMAVNVLHFLKHYRGSDEMLKILQNALFEFNKPVEKITTEDDLKKILKKNQEQTKRRKLVYTCNIGGYDAFHDIEDKYTEDDVDYIYISNREGECCCKNFKHVYCNIEGLDSFELNRTIKFNKTLFDCYEKVCYVDANVSIHCKLGRFWDKLESDTDLVLFSHPDRNSVHAELSVLSLSNGNHKKWGFDQNFVSILAKEHKATLNNDLFWLNVQLSTTKRNIYEEIQEMYKKYKLKRDQVYFSLIKNKYGIKTIKISRCKSDLSKFFKKSKIKHECIDGDYNYLVNWSDKFSRPFGGAHL